MSRPLPESATRPHRLVARASCLLAISCSLAACGVSSKRDVNTPPKELTYADQCGLQGYFDQRAAASLPEPSASEEALATNAKGRTSGEGSYVLRDPLARGRFARLLRDEFAGLDPRIPAAVEAQGGRVEVRVKWLSTGPIRRLRPDSDVVVATRAGAIELPPNPCIGDILFGEKIYAMRARFIQNEVNIATGRPMSVPEQETAAPAPRMGVAGAPSAAPSASGTPLAVPPSPSAVQAAPSAAPAPSARRPAESDPDWSNPP